MSGVPVGPLRRSRWLASLVAWCGERASVHTSRRLAAMLLLLVLVVVVPTILLAGAAVWQAVRSEQKVADARLHDTAQALALAVDREIVGRMAALKAFATSPVFSPDPAAANMRAVDAQARQVARQIGAWVFLATRDGTRLVMTALPPGAPLPPIRGRDLLERIFATKTPGVGNLLVSAISHEYTFATAAPIMGADGNVRLMLASSFDARRMHELLASQNLPPGSFAAVTDAANVVVGRSDGNHRAVVGKAVPPDNVAHFAGQEAGIFQAVSIDRSDRVFGFHAISSAPGWTLFVTEPAVSVLAVARGPLLWLVGAGAVALLLGLSLAVLTARRILRPVRQLGAHVRGIRAGETPVNAGALPPAGITEFEELRRGFEAAEAALRVNELRLRDLLATVDLGIFMTRDLDGTIRFWSKGAEALYGWTAEEAIGQVSHTLMHTRFPQPLPEIDATLRETGAWAGDLRHRTRDGREIIVATRKILRRTADGQLTVLEILADVTGQRAVEAALAASEAQLRTIVETVPVGLVMAELPSGRVVGGNSYVETLLRHPVLYSPDIHSYDEWVSFHADGSRVDGHEYPLARMVAGEETPSIEVLYQRGDGTRAWTRIMGRPVRNKHGELTGGVVALVDIDGERQASEALAESEARLKLFIERAPAAIAMFDTDMRYLAASRRFVSAYNLAAYRDPASLIGRSHYDVFPDIPDEWRDIHRRVLAGEVLSAEQDPFPRADGRTDWVRWEMAPWRRMDRSVGGVLLFTEVITARIEAERAVAETAARLRLALDAADLGTWRWEVGQDTQQNLDWDTRCKALFGLPPDAIVDYDVWAQRVHPEDRPKAEAGVVRALDPADPDDDYVCDYRACHPDGTVLWLAAVGRAFFEPDPGAPAGRRAVRILGTIRDITTMRQEEAGRREREERDRYLLALEERLRTAVTARDIMTAACETLGRTLKASLVGIGDVEPDGRHTMVESEWRAGPTPTSIGRHRLAGNDGERLAPLRQGLAMIMADVTTAPLTADDPAAQAVYAGLAIRAIIDVPLIREGRLRAILYVADSAPRTWSHMDLALAKETLERTWHAAERARAERALADSEDRLRLALEAGEMGIWDWDLPADRLLWDRREFALFGLDAADGMPQGQQALARVHPEDRPGLDDAISQALRPGNGLFQHDFRVQRPDGTYRWIGGYGHAIRDRDGRAVRLVGLNFDITQQKEAAAVLARDKEGLARLVEERTAALRETEARLAQAAKMEALGRLAGGVAHDFNNVLQAVQGGIALASKRLTDESRPAARFLTIAGEAAERGAAVTNRLLAFARRGDLTAAPVEPASLLEDLVHLLRHTLGPSVALTVACSPGTPALFADVGQLEAVLVNLANNARDALPGGCGSIVLAAEPVTICAGMPGVPDTLAPGDYIRLSVKDDGKGMAPEVLARVTEPFFTTKPKGKGTGFGLAMALGFAGQSGGALSIDSTLGQGTTVSLWLPQAHPEERVDRPAQGPRPEEPVPPDRPGMAVLLVDDEHGVRTVIAMALADRGHTVAEAEDGATALARLDAGVAVDVLVTDLAMPGGMDGLALIREARRRRPNLPAVLITGHTGDASQDMLRAVVETGPFAMLRKPASVDAVEAQVAAMAQPAA